MNQLSLGEGTGRSLRLRLMVSITLLAALFLTMVGVVLDGSFQTRARNAAAEQLDVLLLSLAGSAELTAQGLQMPTALLDARWSQPGSGLYGVVLSDGGRVLWRSASLLGSDSVPALAATPESLPGRTYRDEIEHEGLGGLFRSALTLVFEQPGGADVSLKFLAAMSQRNLDAEVAGFRNTLRLGLGAVGVLLVLAQLWLLRVLTQPLAQLADAVAAVERGERPALGGGWPKEVSGVTTNLDRFIAHERALRERYKHMTDDLAHSLKTPIAVLRNALSADDIDRDLLTQQLARMQAVLNERLDRVAVRPLLGRPRIAAEGHVQSLARALRRLYPNHAIDLQVDVDCQFPGDERDLLELAGNLIDNACKYGKSRVVVAARSPQDFELTVEDDGPGVPERDRAAILQRGVRADTQVSGQGIGLAVVGQLVEAYGGSLRIDASPALGGARVRIAMPAATSETTR